MDFDTAISEDGTGRTSVICCSIYKKGDLDPKKIAAMPVVDGISEVFNLSEWEPYVDLLLHEVKGEFSADPGSIILETMKFASTGRRCLAVFCAFEGRFTHGDLVSPSEYPGVYAFMASGQEPRTCLDMDGMASHAWAQDVGAFFEAIHQATGKSGPQL